METRGRAEMEEEGEGGRRERERWRMWVHEEEQREIAAWRQESGSEERTPMWKRRKERVMRRDGEGDTRGRSEGGMDGEERREGWRGDRSGSLEGSILQVPSDKPDGVLAFLGKQRLYVQTEQ